MSDFVDFYGQDEVDFRVLPATKIMGGLRFQIIPICKNGLEDYSKSLVIDEVAFSIIENIFFKDALFAHWGQTFIQLNEIDPIIHDLQEFSRNLEFLNYKSINEICTVEIKRNKNKYHPMIKKMIEDINSHINLYRSIGYEKICIYGI